MKKKTLLHFLSRENMPLCVGFREIFQSNNSDTLVEGLWGIIAACAFYLPSFVLIQAGSLKGSSCLCGSTLWQG